MNNETVRIKTLSKRPNQIYKERFNDGWTYIVTDREGNPLSRITFFKPVGKADRLTNSDLLDIVRDRLSIMNRGSHRTARSLNCAQHVTEALFWADMKNTADADEPEAVTITETADETEDN